MTEPEVKVIIHEVIEKVLDPDKIVFRKFCIDRHTSLDASRKERKEEIESLERTMNDYNKAINEKLDKIFVGIVGLLATVIASVVTILITYFIHDKL